MVCAYSIDELRHQYLWQPCVSARSYTSRHTFIQQTALFPSPMERINIRYLASFLGEVCLFLLAVFLSFTNGPFLNYF